MAAVLIVVNFESVASPNVPLLVIPRLSPEVALWLISFKPVMLPVFVKEFVAVSFAASSPLKASVPFVLVTVVASIVLMPSMVPADSPSFSFVSVAALIEPSFR